MKNNESKPKKSRLIKVKETADRLGISPKTIYNQLASGKFPIRARRFGGSIRFLEEDVENFIQSI